MSHVPELVQTTKLGGTVHSYNLPGGKREFTRFLACYLGSCKFCNDMEEAIAYLSTIEVLPSR
jgi:hypothetical protein